MEKTVLRERASEVTEFDEALVELSREMLKVMYTAHGIGLAAEQVGHTKRMFVIDIPAESDVDEKGGAVAPRRSADADGVGKFSKLWHIQMR